MKRLFRVAARLYPSWWRRRYESEFEALLEDVRPGWRELFDVIKGALTMQIKTAGTIPAVCAVAGAIVGGIVVMRTPEVYAATAKIRLKAGDSASAQPAIAQELLASLERALDSSGGARAATTVTMARGEWAGTTVRLAYLDRDPAQAQRVAAMLTAAVATEASLRAASTEVLEFPGLPTSPIKRDYPMAVASGGGAGLVAGGVVLLLLKSRRRPAGAG